jgi:hypothetical protein
MNEKNFLLLVLWLTLATVATLLIVAPLVSEMAYARAAAGNPGERGRAITSVRCSPTGCTASSTATGSTGAGGGSGRAGGIGISTGIVTPPPSCEVRACQPPPVVTPPARGGGFGGGGLPR